MRAIARCTSGGAHSWVVSTGPTSSGGMGAEEVSSPFKRTLASETEGEA
jgi:hypothetical protein